jgi:hypothetical protein
MNSLNVLALVLLVVNLKTVRLWRRLSACAQTPPAAQAL